MKIGIITYHRAHNYGATLQSYALKHYLRLEGFNAELIDYWPKYRKGMYNLFSFADICGRYYLIKIAIRFIKLIVMCVPRYTKNKKFKKFHEQYFSVEYNNPILKGEDIPNNYDVYIFGSDQIWRYNSFKMFKGYDGVYWGDFPKNEKKSTVKKITYAASMGKLQKVDENYIRTHLIQFDAISVRENALRFLLQEYTDKSIVHVLDPIFLLSIKQWSNLNSEDPLQGVPYIILYNLLRSKDAENLAKRVAKSKGLHILRIYGDAWPPTLSTSKKYSIGPQEFISYFLHADFVVSTSFHGVAFAIHFRKQFVSLGMGASSQRVTDILGKYNLEDRYLSDVSEMERLPPIDYNKINEKIERDIALSKNFLIKAIKA